MATIFNGREFAAKKSEELKRKVLDLNTKGIFPHLASILIGSDPASKLYVGLKKKAGEKVGIQVDIYYLPETSKIEEILSLIESLNEDKSVSGIMVQLPIPGEIGKSRKEIIEAIDAKKDVDGLKEDSLFLHPTSKAVIDILSYAKTAPEVKDLSMHSICVVGATGMVGKPLVKELKKLGYEVTECDLETSGLKEKTLGCDVVISATGVKGIIKKDMVKEGAVIIDVGSPKGDFNPEVADKASFFTPVPGGVGPVTIVSLLENLIFLINNL